MVDRGRRRRQSPLESGQSEPDDDPSALVACGLHPHGAVHAVAHIGSDRLVERGLGPRQLEVEAVSVAYREQALAVEGAQVLLDLPPHHVAHVRHRRTVAVGAARTGAGPQPASEALSVDQSHERQEVLVLAVVRCGCEQQQMAGAVPQRLAEG